MKKRKQWGSAKRKRSNPPKNKNLKIKKRKQWGSAKRKFKKRLQKSFKKKPLKKRGFKKRV
ncbi:hypothetical protein C2R51_03380 [Helicobacter pylori]|nr:hypothetical protein C2R51_03380 [Helicobacter pylori]